MLNTLITNRTLADVQRTKELADKIQKGLASQAEYDEYLSGCLGAYNASDLNRVNSAMLFCQSILESVGLSVELSGIKTDWSMSDIPTESQMQDYLDNLDALRQAVNDPLYFPAIPSNMSGLDYSGANAIEEMLIAIGDEVAAIEAAWHRCGEYGLYCGVSVPDFNDANMANVGTADAMTLGS